MHVDDMVMERVQIEDETPWGHYSVQQYFLMLDMLVYNRDIARDIDKSFKRIVDPNILFHTKSTYASRITPASGDPVPYGNPGGLPGIGTWALIYCNAMRNVIIM